MSKKKRVEKTAEKSKNKVVILDEHSKAKSADKKSYKSAKKSQYETKIKPFLSEIERFISCGISELEVAKYYGIGRTSWYKYKRENSELNELLFRSKKKLKVDLVNQAYEVAMGYEYEEVKMEKVFDGDNQLVSQKVTRYKHRAKADGAMIQFLLINRFHDEFARDPQAIALREKSLELEQQNNLTDNTEEI